MLKRFRNWFLTNKRLGILLLILVVLTLGFTSLLLFSAQFLGTFKESLPVIGQNKDDEVSNESKSGSSENTISDGDINKPIENFEVLFSKNPEMVNKSFRLFEIDESGVDPNEEIDEIYKTGSVSSGTYEGKNLVNCGVYAYSFGELISGRFLYCNNDSQLYYLGTYDLGSISGIEAYFNKNMIVVSDEDGLVSMQFSTFKLFDTHEVVGTSGTKYKARSIVTKIYPRSDLKSIDKIGEIPVYEITDYGIKRLIIPTQEGFYQELLKEE